MSVLPSRLITCTCVHTALTHDYNCGYYLNTVPGFCYALLYGSGASNHLSLAHLVYRRDGLVGKYGVFMWRLKGQIAIPTQALVAKGTPYLIQRKHLVAAVLNAASSIALSDQVLRAARAL